MLVSLLSENMTSLEIVKSLFRNSFILRRPSIAIFADIIKIVTMFTRQSLKTQKKIEMIKNYVSK